MINKVLECSHILWLMGHVYSLFLHKFLECSRIYSLLYRNSLLLKFSSFMCSHIFLVQILLLLFFSVGYAAAIDARFQSFLSCKIPQLQLYDSLLSWCKIPKLSLMHTMSLTKLLRQMAELKLETCKVNAKQSQYMVCWSYYVFLCQSLELYIWLFVSIAVLPEDRPFDQLPKCFPPVPNNVFLAIHLAKIICFNPYISLNVLWCIHWWLNLVISVQTLLCG